MYNVHVHRKYYRMYKWLFLRDLNLANGNKNPICEFNFAVPMHSAMIFSCNKKIFTDLIFANEQENRKIRETYCP